MLEQSVPEGPVLEQLVKNSSQWEGLSVKKSVEFLVGRTPLWSRESVSSEEEGMADTTCDKLTTASFTTEVMRGGRVENLGVKLSPGRSQECGEGVLGCDVISSLSYFDLCANKLKSIP